MIFHQRSRPPESGRPSYMTDVTPLIERSVDDVAVAGDPADVGGGPADVGVGLDVKDVVVRRRGLGEVAAGRVKDALGLRGRTRGVHDEHRVLGVEGLVRVGVALACRRCRATSGHGPRPIRRRRRCAARRGRRARSGHSSSASSTAGFSGLGRTAAERAVGGDDELTVRVEDATARASRRRSPRR